MVRIDALAIHERAICTAFTAPIGDVFGALVIGCARRHLAADEAVLDLVLLTLAALELGAALANVAEVVFRDDPGCGFGRVGLDDGVCPGTPQQFPHDRHSEIASGFVCGVLGLGYPIDSAQDFAHASSLRPAQFDCILHGSLLWVE